MYYDTDTNSRIRSDNGHLINGKPFPHIDIEHQNRRAKKFVFDSDPSDYEASVNTVEICRTL